MDRTYVSFNLPNLITIPIMAVLGWFVLGLIWQLVKKGVGSNPSDNSAVGGY